MEEKKFFQNAIIVLNGEIIEADGGTSLINSEVVEVMLDLEIPIDNMTIKDRLNASGLIHEFKLVFRKDKIRVREILKVLGVSESYTEEILLRNSYVLPCFERSITCITVSMY